MTVESPIKPMLAKLQTELPLGDGWLYEPKWDGFRAIIFRDKDSVRIASRDQRPLERYFPELVPMFLDVLPDACVVDGEIFVCTDEGLNFDTLQMRIHPAASRVTMLSGQYPAGFIAFDALALGDDDLRERPARERRKVLESLFPAAADPTDEVPSALTATYTPQTSEAEDAGEWLAGIEKAGIEGVIAKRADQIYLEGQRAMIKVKKRKTIDCVVGAYRLSKSGDGIGSLLLGLYAGDTLHYVGHTSSFKADEKRRLLAELKPLEGGDSFGPGRSPDSASRWNSGKEQSPWVPLRIERVCEVAFDKMQGDRFRHAATFLRWRSDREPRDCNYDQVQPGRG